MLADEIVANGAPGSGVDISCILPAIARSQKFVLSAEFAAVADALSEDYTGLVRVFDRCRLPYPETWVEVAHADRPNFINAKLHAPMFQVQPKRIGFLLQATRDDLSAWKTHMFWSTNTSEYSAAALALTFDMTATLNDDAAMTAAQIKAVRAETSDIIPNVTDHPGWVAADHAVKLSMIRHTNIVESDYGLPLADRVPMDRLKDYYAAVMRLAHSDWAGEAGYLLAVVGLLNARNATETEPVNYGKLNKARSKRGKYPLFEHRVLKIAQRRMTRPDTNGAARGDYTPIRGHFVRGHFKTRRSGVYFWHPHARGTFSHGVIEKEYRL